MINTNLIEDPPILEYPGVTQPSGDFVDNGPGSTIDNIEVKTKTGYVLPYFPSEPFVPSSGDFVDGGPGSTYIPPFTSSPIGDTNIFPNALGNTEPSGSTQTGLTQPGITFTTMENNPIGTNPDTVPSLQSPLEQVRTLMDVFNHDLGTTGAEPYIKPSEPGTTVIPPAVYDSGGGSSSWVIWLGVLGIVVTLAAHWYFNRKR